MTDVTEVVGTTETPKFKPRDLIEFQGYPQAAIAWLLYGRRPVPETAPAAGPAVTAARNDLYGDAINESLLMRPGQWLTRLSVYFDNRGIDGIVNSLAAAMGGSSGRLRKLQNGFVRSYALFMFLGAVLLVGTLFVVRI